MAGSGRRGLIPGLALAFVLAGEWRRRLAFLNPALAAEMESLAAEAAGDLRHPWRLMSKGRSDDASRAA